MNVTYETSGTGVEEATVLLVCLRNEIVRRLENHNIQDRGFAGHLEDIETCARLMRTIHAALDAELNKPLGGSK